MKTVAKRAAKVRRQARKSERGALSGLDVIFEDDLLRVTATGDPAASRVVLVFTGVGERLGKLAPEEFVGSASRADTIAYFITDKAKSWFNAFPADKVVDVLKPLVSGKAVYSLGNSMGGYGAIWISRYLPVKVALAFGAQYSVNPVVVPGETRWSRLREAIADWRDESLAEHFCADTSYVTINGQEDELQWSLFPELPNTRHLILAGIDHNVPSFLKQNGRLQEVIACVFDGAGDLRALLGERCYLRGADPPATIVESVAPLRVKPIKTIEHFQKRAAIKAEKKALMTPEEQRTAAEKRKAKRAPRAPE